MARKSEILPPTTLFCVTILGYVAKQTLLLILVLSVYSFTLQSQRHVVGRSISYGEDKGGLHRSWSES